MGMTMPALGMVATVPQTARQASRADALFSTTQQRVLALLFGQPDRSFYATELIRLVEGVSGAVWRELAQPKVWSIGSDDVLAA